MPLRPLCQAWPLASPYGEADILLATAAARSKPTVLFTVAALCRVRCTAPPPTPPPPLPSPRADFSGLAGAQGGGGASRRPPPSAVTTTEVGESPATSSDVYSPDEDVESALERPKSTSWVLAGTHLLGGGRRV